MSLLDGGLNPPPPVFDLPPPPPPPNPSEFAHGEVGSTGFCAKRGDELRVCDNLATTFGFSKSIFDSDDASDVGSPSLLVSSLAAAAAIVVLIVCVAAFVVWRRYASSRRLHYLHSPSSSSAFKSNSSSSGGVVGVVGVVGGHNNNTYHENGRSQSHHRGNVFEASLADRQPLIYDDASVGFYAAAAGSPPQAHAQNAFRFADNGNVPGAQNHFIPLHPTAASSYHQHPSSTLLSNVDSDSRIYEEVKSTSREDHYSPSFTPSSSRGRRHQEYSSRDTLRLQQPQQQPQTYSRARALRQQQQQQQHPETMISSSTGSSDEYSHVYNQHQRGVNLPYTVQNQSGALVEPFAVSSNSWRARRAAQECSSSESGGSGSGFLSSLFRRKKKAPPPQRYSATMIKPVQGQSSMVMLDNLQALQALQQQQVCNRTALPDNPVRTRLRTLDRPSPASIARSPQVHHNRSRLATLDRRLRPELEDPEELKVLMPDPDSILPRAPWTDFTGRENWSDRLTNGRKGRSARPESLEMDVSTATAMSQLPSADAVMSLCSQSSPSPYDEEEDDFTGGDAKAKVKPRPAPRAPASNSTNDSFSSSNSSAQR